MNGCLCAYFKHLLENSREDSEWLQALINVKEEHHQDLSDKCFKDGISNESIPNLHSLPPFAKVVAWLILSHHKLPMAAPNDSFPELEYIGEWMKDNFCETWNSPHCRDEDQENRIRDNWSFKKPIPIKSNTWRAKA